MYLQHNLHTTTYNGFGQLTYWKVGFLTEMIWQIRRQALI
jgi:hypothetical protein